MRTEQDRGARRPDGRHGPSSQAMVINCVRSGKDRVKDFVICFTSSPSSANERPVIPFVNLTGCLHHDSGAATGSCNVRGDISRVSSVAVQTLRSQLMLAKYATIVRRAGAPHDRGAVSYTHLR